MCMNRVCLLCIFFWWDIRNSTLFLSGPLEIAYVPPRKTAVRHNFAERDLSLRCSSNGRHSSTSPILTRVRLGVQIARPSLLLQASKFPHYSCWEWADRISSRLRSQHMCHNVLRSRLFPLSSSSRASRKRGQWKNTCSMSSYIPVQAEQSGFFSSSNLWRYARKHPWPVSNWVR